MYTINYLHIYSVRHITICSNIIIQVERAIKEAGLKRNYNISRVFMKKISNYNLDRLETIGIVANNS